MIEHRLPAWVNNNMDRRGNAHVVSVSDDGTRKWEYIRRTDNTVSNKPGMKYPLIKEDLVFSIKMSGDEYGGEGTPKKDWFEAVGYHRNLTGPVHDEFIIVAFPDNGIGAPIKYHKYGSDGARRDQVFHEGEGFRTSALDLLKARRSMPMALDFKAMVGNLFDRAGRRSFILPPLHKLNTPGDEEFEKTHTQRPTKESIEFLIQDACHRMRLDIAKTGEGREIDWKTPRESEGKDQIFSKGVGEVIGKNRVICLVIDHGNVIDEIDIPGSSRFPIPIAETPGIGVTGMHPGPEGKGGKNWSEIVVFPDIPAYLSQGDVPFLAQQAGLDPNKYLVYFPVK